MNFVVSSTYDAIEHSLEDNIQVLGRTLAEQIEKVKGLPDSSAVAVVTKVDKNTGTITITSIDRGSGK